MSTEAPGQRSSAEIAAWLTDQLATILDIDAGGINPNDPVTVLGIDSMQYIGMIGDLEDWLGCRFEDNPLIDYPTVNGLAEFVADQLQRGRTVIVTDSEN